MGNYKTVAEEKNKDPQYNMEKLSHENHKIWKKQS